MEQAGRVELVELQVGDPAAGAPGHGDAVAGGDVRLVVYWYTWPRRRSPVPPFCAVGFHPLQLAVPDVRAHHSARARQADFCSR